MYVRLQQIVSKNKVALSNAGYLTCLQALTLAFPLISYPYLIKTLGSSLYGEILLAQGVAFFLCAFVSYGFNLSATREISLNKNRLRKVSKIYTATIISKVIILIPSIFIFFCYGYYSASEDMRLLYFFCMGPLIYEVFFPTWLYQGLEKMKYITVLNVICRTFLLISIFTIVKSPEDGIKLAIVNFSFYLTISIMSQWVVYAKLKVVFEKIGWRNVVRSFKNGYAIFISTIFIAIKDRLNILIVGAVFGPSQVVIYDLAIKIVSVLSIPQNIIITAFFPQVVKRKNVKEIMNISILICAINVVLVTASYFVLPYLLSGFVEGDFKNNMLVIYTLLTSIILVGISGSIGRLLLLPFGYDKLLAKTVVANCLIYFISIVAYIYLTEQKTILDFSILILIIYFTEMCIRFGVVKRVQADDKKFCKKSFM